MAERFEVYQCGVCGNVVGMLIAGGGQLTCCNLHGLWTQEV